MMHVFQWRAWSAAGRSLDKYNHEPPAQYEMEAYEVQAATLAALAFYRLPLSTY
jgi:hypothetical protein